MKNSGQRMTVKQKNKSLHDSIQLKNVKLFLFEHLYFAVFALKSLSS